MCPVSRSGTRPTRTQVRQIVWNLATNGLRAMKDGGRLLLSVRERRDATGRSDVVLAVQDEGCGIPADEIDAIFQPFRSTFERGTGLGLATVHRIVTDYNGTIQVSSAVGAGTTMQVRLPAQHEVAEALVGSACRREERDRMSGPGDVRARGRCPGGGGPCEAADSRRR